MDLPAHPVEEIQFARVVLAPADNATGRGDQFLMPGDLLAIVAKGPDSARVEVTVDVGADEVFQTLAVIDVAAGQRTEVRVRSLDDGRQDRRRAALALGPERGRCLNTAPAVVAALLDLDDRLPQVLADLTDPQVPGLAVEAVPPRLAQAIRPHLGPRPLLGDERIVLRNAIVL